eukprot:1085200-Pyramimonas_sp.AAC.1
MGRIHRSLNVGIVGSPRFLFGAPSYFSPRVSSLVLPLSGLSAPSYFMFLPTPSDQYASVPLPRVAI